MRSRFGAHVLAIALTLVTGTLGHPLSGQNTQAPPRAGAPDTGPPAGWPDQHPIPDVPVNEGRPDQLPRPSLTEPFAIGEALHDPARVDTAIVSLLNLMGIEIAPDDPDAPATIGGGRVRLFESEVRALIEIGRTDAEAQGQDPDGPFHFRDLHATLAPALPGVTAEGLADLYRAQYERQPESLVPLVLMGQPIEADTPLLRTELWLLHADGVLSAASSRRIARRGPRLTFVAAVHAQSAGSSGYFGPSGVLQRSLQPPRGSTLSGIEWAELQWRLPLIAASSVTLTQGARIHERHGGSGAAVTLQARVRLRPIQLTSTGTVVNPAPLAAAGLPVTWQPDPTVLGHASPATPVSTTVGLDGIARLSFAPRPEAAQGRGVLASDRGRTTISFDYAALVSRYRLNAPTPGGGAMSVGTGVDLEWHVPEGIEFRISNNYDVGSLGLTRAGWDYAIGSMQLDEQGDYRGKARLISSTQRMTVPGRNCVAEVTARQWADVVGIAIEEKVPVGSDLASFYTAVHRPGDYRWQRGQAATYFRLEFTPTSPPDYVTSGSGVVCQDEIPHPGSANFIPLNDAQWTITGYGSGRGVETANRAGYAIAVPDEGLLRYEDRTSENASLVTSKEFGSVNLGGLLKARSIWYVTVTRTKVK